jgi:energy-coupling factor transporter ATP-binding protein EcfA2
LRKKIYKLAGRVETVFQDTKTQFFSVNATQEIVFGCENMGFPP